MPDTTKEPANGNRVTTREFYKRQLAIKDDFARMETRIVDKIDKTLTEVRLVSNAVSANEERSKTNRDSINDLRKKSNWFDGIIGVVSLVMAYFGFRAN